MEQGHEMELFRMEKSVMTKGNFDELGLVSGDRIPEALLEFICYEHQYNIFGYGVLDPVEFARMFHFSHRFLIGKHDSPYQLQLRKIVGKANLISDRRARRAVGGVCPEEFLCESRIENALFILANYALSVTSTAVLEDNSLIRQCGFLRVLEEFTMVQDGRTGKVTYLYKLDDKFRRNLSSLYLTTRRDSLVALRKSGLGALYVFLLKLREALLSEGRCSTTPDRTPAFEYLCGLAGIHGSEPKYRKRDLNRTMRKLNEETELEFTVSWVCGAGRERYTPLFTFRAPDDMSLLQPDSRYMKVCRTRERIDIAVVEFKHNLVSVCPFKGNRYSSDAEDFFYEWIRSEREEDRRLFAFALENTFVNIGSGIPGDVPARVSLFCHHARMKGKEGFDIWIRDIFTGYQGFTVPPFRCIDSERHR